MANALRELLLSSLNEVKEEFIGPKDTEELMAYVTDIFPLNENAYKILHVQGNKHKYKATIDCEIKSFQQVEKFIEGYQARTNETLRKVSPRVLSEKNIYDVCYYYRCHHKTQYQPTMSTGRIRCEKPSKRVKNTNCPFSLSIKFRNEIIGDQPPGRIELEWNHNHTVASAQALTFKDISAESKEKIKTMFENGYTPALAYREFLKGIRKEVNGDLELHSYLADRSKAPSRRDFNPIWDGGG